jgi:hypothetical protein
MHYCNAKDKYSIRSHTIILSAVNCLDVGVLDVGVLGIGILDTGVLYLSGVLDIFGTVMHSVNLNQIGCLFYV